MLRVATFSCLIATFTLVPLLSHAEVGVLSYSCETKSTVDSNSIPVYWAECYQPSQRTKDTYCCDGGLSESALKERLRAQSIYSFNQSASIVYEKKEVDDRFVKKDEFTQTRKRLDDTISALPTLLGETVEKTIKASLRDTLKVLIETDGEFRQEISKILKSK